jgi:hypothetical protein
VAAGVDLGAFKILTEAAVSVCLMVPTALKWMMNKTATIIGTQTSNTVSLNAHIPPNEGYDCDMFG